MMKKSLLIGVVAFFMMFATNAFAQDAKSCPKSGDKGSSCCQSQGHGGCCGEAIPNLTDDQKTKIKDLKVKMEKSNMEIDNQIRELEARLISVTTGSKANKDAAFVVLEELSNLKLSKQKNCVENQLAIRAILKEDQQFAYDQMRIKKMKDSERSACGEQKRCEQKGGQASVRKDGDQSRTPQQRPQQIQQTQKKK